MPISAPKFKLDEREPDGVERPEDEADGGLAADEAGDGPVDLARQPADGVAVPARQPSIDGARPCGPSRPGDRRRRPA